MYSCFSGKKILLNTLRNYRSIGDMRSYHLMIQFMSFRRISCHGRNHSHARCEYSWTISFFVITTTASTRCLVQNFQLICCSQRVNATSQYNDSGSSRCSKWPNDRMVAVVKHCWLLVQGTRACKER